MDCPRCGSSKKTIHNRAQGRVVCKDCSKYYQDKAYCRNPEDQELIKEVALTEEVKTLKSALKEEQKQRVKDNRIAELLEKYLPKPSSPPKWLSPKRPKKKDVAIATAFLSDTHFDEVVFPEQINYINGYNREIASNRLKLFFENTVRISRDHIAGIEIEGLVLAMGGDMVSGNIHEELKSTNDAPIMDTVIYWVDQLTAGIEMLAGEFGKVFIPCVTGNHGRNSKKVPAKNRARDNFDWLIYKLVEKHFRTDKRVTFQVAEGTEARWTVYGTKYQMSHGDQFRGGNGIAGVMSPIMLGDHRKRQREQATDTPYDILLLGHFHQYKDLGKVIINGSLKGYDEYAASCNFGYEPPRQAFWLTDPRYGKTITAPIHVYKEGEGWEREVEEAIFS